MLAPLHVKSYYSLGYGTASPAALVERAAAQGLAALALTDLDSLAGQPQFHEHCARAGIRPVTGVELRRRAPKERGPGRRAGRIVLLARDRSGYRSLCRIVSRRRKGTGTRDEQAAARDPVQAVAAHPDGLYVLTDDAQTLADLLATPGVDRTAVRGLIVRPAASGDLEARMMAAAAAHGVPLVADPEVELLDADDDALQVLVAAIHSNRPVRELAPVYRNGGLHWQRPPQSNAALFTDLPGAVEEAARVADACQLDLLPGRPVLPGADVFGGSPPEGLLAERCASALRDARAAGRCGDAAYAKRLTAELEVISRLGYAAYFLLAAEIADAARHKSIPLAPRGSAVASLVVHLLGISPLDPLAQGLYFEGFLHGGRESPPDIDLDVCSKRRDVLLQWMRRRFGRERTAMVGALQGYGLPLALRLGLKALGTAPQRVERLCALLESRRELQQESAPHEVVESLIPESLFPEPERRLIPLIGRLVGIPRQLAMHPGGLVVADGRLDDRVPVEAAKRGLGVTQYDLHGIRVAGLMKLDVLGNRFLSQLVETAVLARAAAIPLDDATTLERIDRADTIGCYQLEAPAIRALLRRLHIRSLEDCVAALALVQPGAAAGAAKRDYVRRVRGQHAIEPVHPVIAARLDRTHGLLLYDEDLMDVLSAVAGISRSAADRIRTAIIDADSPEKLRAAEAGFISASLRRGSDPALARAAWQTAVKFAACSFSRAHAWSHGLLAWQAAWLKSQHPVEFGCALLNDYGGAYPLRTLGADLIRAGITLHPPSVNESALVCTPVQGGGRAIRVGLSRIKHLTRRAAAELLAMRGRNGPYTELEELCRSVRLARRELRALILCGACDGLPPLSSSAYPLPHEAFIEACEQGRGVDQALAAAARLEHALDETTEPERTRDWQTLVRIRNELEITDLHPSGHPMALLRSEAQRLGCRASGELAERARHDGSQRTRFAGIVAASRRHRPAGEGRRALYYLTLEDEAGLVETIIPPPAYPRLAPRVTTPGPYIVEGTLEEDYGHIYMVIGELLPFYDRDRLTPD